MRKKAKGPYRKGPSDSSNSQWNFGLVAFLKLINSYYSANSQIKILPLLEPAKKYIEFPNLAP